LKTHKSNKVFQRTALASTLAFILSGPLATQAFAQDAAAEAAKKEEEAKKAAAKTEPKELEKVKVTGSLISRLGFDSVSPVQVITAETSATVGQLDTADILQSSSIASGSTQISNQFSGFVVEGGNGVQTVGLRGLGSNRTLVLLDGKRPGPAGTRGQVGAFDLNVVPSSIINRVEILKDGGGSIYGSDAVAGVVNIITRKAVDKPSLTVTTSLPFEGGGERWSASGAMGWDFDKGGIVTAFEFSDSEALTQGDRDFLNCGNELIKDANGNRIDRLDKSITAGTRLEGCNNLYANTVISGATRYIPAPDGVTIGPIAGYRPRTNSSAIAPSPPSKYPGTAYYEDQLNFEMLDDAHIFAEQKRLSLYAAFDYNFDSVDWYGQFLYTNRETNSHRYRQFFPTMDYRSVGLSASSLPIMPFRSDQNIDVDYFYVATGLKGAFGESSWSWNADLSFSRSDGDYEVLSIDANLTGDRFRDLDGGGSPVNYLDPFYLSGRGINELQDAVGVWHTGNTIYDQFVASAITSGTLFEMPAGAVGGAFGVEYRDFSIDDNPSDLERAGRLWGQSSATGTEGDDNVYEVFGEIEMPLLSGLPGVEMLTFNGSARWFQYDTVEDSDSVWKAGLLWQIIPSVSLRSTIGTSYRAPGLYELYLGDQTAFVGQLNDPCVEYLESANPNIIANCAAAGVPPTLTGAGASIEVISGGGLGVLKPETSKSFTAGIVFTPASSNFSMSVDYFEIEVNDQIDQLGAGAILGGCYGLPVFPNAFCDLHERRGLNEADPYTVAFVKDSYINVNTQVTKGYDLNLRWDGEFDFGKIEIESQFTYTTEAYQELFDSDAPSGFESNDFNGTISSPELVGNVRTALVRGDWTYTWGMEYVGETENFFTNPATYQGVPNPQYDYTAEDRLYHNLSVFYRADEWSLLLGVNNVFDTSPPNISTGVGSTRYGNIPAFATQYDWFGRSFFARINYEF
jgi:iron complex outermembrane receptor protein